MLSSLNRAEVLPETELPSGDRLLEEGRRLAAVHPVGSCPFLTENAVSSECEFKVARMAENVPMFHGQFGYRNVDKSRRAYGEIHDRLAAAGYGIDRYGICLDWSMGYPAVQRSKMPRGTGLILERSEDFLALTQEAPVAPHFGDFVIGTPASVENTAAALAAGSTAIGNLGQYFTFRMPRWDDDVGTTAETVKALALCAAQPVPILIHSNLDDGFAALFCDLVCGIGAVVLERYVVDELIGGRVSHCYGHVFSEPIARLAFGRAMKRVSATPGSMIYGNTTIFVASEVENYANLASYLLVDLVGQQVQPSGHGLNPVPVTEALRIPEIDEIVEAHLFANRLAERSVGFEPLFDLEEVDRLADQLVVGGFRFAGRVLAGLRDADIDIQDPFELLLSLRRIGAKRLEELFGPGARCEGALRGRTPLVRATTVAALEAQGIGVVSKLALAAQERIRRASLTACVTCTDVHEYGKILLESVLGSLGVTVVDAGVSSDPSQVAEMAIGADFVAISTYSGIALDYAEALRQEMGDREIDVPVFIGGKLNQIAGDTRSSMPVDVTSQLEELDVVVCHRMEDLLAELRDLIEGRA